MSASDRGFAGGNGKGRLAAALGGSVVDLDQDAFVRSDQVCHRQVSRET